VNFISHSVVTGYTMGAAILIATNQVKHVIGVPIPNEATFVNAWLFVFHHVSEFNLFTLSLGVGTILVAILSKKLFPKLPYLLLAMLAGTAFTYFLGHDRFPVPLVGQMPRGLPAFHVPDLSYPLIQELIPSAFAVAMLGAIEVISISRSIAAQSRQRLDSNQEFIGLGLSNIVGGFFSCYAGSGSFTRSGLNYTSGAKTPMAAILAALLLMVIILLVAPWAAYLPIPTMGGIILLVAYSLIDFKSIRQIFRTSKSEIAVMAMTALSILFINLQFSILIGVFFSLTFYLMRTSKPKVILLAPGVMNGVRKFRNAELHQLPQCPQLHIIRIDESLFFGAVENTRTTLYELSKTKKHILIIGTGINFIDTWGAELLVSEAERMKSLGGGLYFSHMKKTVRDFLSQDYKKRIGDSNFFQSKEEAIAAIYTKLDASICKTCEVRIFTECARQMIRP
jgi:SulP family sulfate permease